MPHDRLYAESHQAKGGRPDVYSHVSTVEVSRTQDEEKKTIESLKEHLMPIEDINDEMIDLFLQIQASMPDLDHIEVSKRIKS